MNKIKNLNIYNWNYITIEDLLISYRYLSAITIVLFYVIFTPENTNIKYTAPVLICISSVILNYLYKTNKDNKKYVTLLLFIETICTSVIILMTGGSNSTFIWYSFNSIIISFIILKNMKYTLLCLSAYLLSITVVHINSHSMQSFNHNIFLCLILFTGLLCVIYKCMNDINLKNIELQKANCKIEDTMRQVLNLCDAMHIFTMSDNQQDIIDLSLEYISTMLNSNNAAFLSYNNKEFEFQYHNDDNIEFDDNLILYIKNNFLELTKHTDPIKYNYNGNLYVFCPVIKNINTYGMFLLEVKNIKKESFKPIVFICELTATVIEKIGLEKINSNLLISNEQNRIASEIHDGVLQSLFSTSCYIYALIKKNSINEENEITCENLNFIRNSINNSISDLRDTIYSLSLYKYGKSIFIDDIKEKISEIKEFSDIIINLSIPNDVERLSLLQKKSLYKIICELLHNSVKHSNAKIIKINMSIKDSHIILCFYDDGIGFNYEEIVIGNRHGLGLKNIEYLTGILHGNCIFKSNKHEGMTFEANIPL